MILLIGAGGHAKVVLDALLARGTPASDIMVRDGDPALAGRELMGIGIDTPELPEEFGDLAFHIALGDGNARQRLLGIIRMREGHLETIMHPAAIVSRSGQIGQGCFLAAGSVVGPLAAVGSGTIVNHNAVVDHDCVIGDCCHIAPNATIGGGARLGCGILIGSGAVVLPGRTVGDGSVIGSGAVVTRDVPPGVSWTGIPARSNSERRV